MKRIHLTLVLATVFCVAGFAAQANAGPVGTLEFNLGYAKSSTEVIPDESMGGGLAFGAGYWRSASPTVAFPARRARTTAASAPTRSSDARSSRSTRRRASTPAS